MKEKKKEKTHSLYPIEFTDNDAYFRRCICINFYYLLVFLSVVETLSLDECTQQQCHSLSIGNNFLKILTLQRPRIVEKWQYKGKIRRGRVVLHRICITSVGSLMMDNKHSIGTERTCVHNSLRTRFTHSNTAP